MKSDVGSDHLVRQDIMVRVRSADPTIPLPIYASLGASGADVHAWIDQAMEIPAMGRCLIPTGLFFEIPPQFEIQVRSRSGLALRNGLFVINSPGTIDSDYRGELKIIVANIGTEIITIQPLERIAQIVLCPVFRAVFTVVEQIAPSQRSDGGFGSTGR